MNITDLKTSTASHSHVSNFVQYTLCKSLEELVQLSQESIAYFKSIKFMLQSPKLTVPRLALLAKCKRVEIDLVLTELKAV